MSELSKADDRIEALTAQVERMRESNADLRRALSIILNAVTSMAVRDKVNNAWHIAAAILRNETPDDTPTAQPSASDSSSKDHA